jgi:hypothetical protein
VTQSKAFTERLEAAVAKYHANALTTAQVLEELIQLAKDIRAARARGEETGLTHEEIAFYDALAENESSRQVMGEPTLRVIAHELVTVIKSNVSIDWMHRDSARANIRRHVKRLLRKYGYPPDLQDAAVQNVLQQAEALSAEWTGAAADSRVALKFRQFARRDRHARDSHHSGGSRLERLLQPRLRTSVSHAAPPCSRSLPLLPVLRETCVLENVEAAKGQR